MTQQDYEQQYDALEENIRDLRRKQKELTSRFLDFKAKFKIGDKVKTSRGETGIVSERNIQFSSIRYRVSKITKTGLASRTTLLYFASEDELKSTE